MLLFQLSLIFDLIGQLSWSESNSGTRFHYLEDWVKCRSDKWKVKSGWKPENLLVNNVKKLNSVCPSLKPEQSNYKHEYFRLYANKWRTRSSKDRYECACVCTCVWRAKIVLKRREIKHFIQKWSIKLSIKCLTLANRNTSSNRSCQI